MESRMTTVIIWVLSLLVVALFVFLCLVLVLLGDICDVVSSILKRLL